MILNSLVHPRAGISMWMLPGPFLKMTLLFTGIDLASALGACPAGEGYTCGVSIEFVSWGSSNLGLRRTFHCVGHLLCGSQIKNVVGVIIHWEWGKSHHLPYGR